MDYEGRLAISYYKEIGILNKEHNITLVQHIQNGTIYVRKELSVYNRDVYQTLKNTPVKGTPRIYALYEEEGKLIVIEEYIAGKTLLDFITEHRLNDFLIQKYAIILCDICTQLHSFKPAIIHRDINPSNIIITESGDLYLIDLNIARPVREGATADTTYLGTNGFAAPEQYGFGVSTIQTDVYGIGSVLKAMLASINNTNLRLNSVVNRATSLAPQDRYTTTAELRKAICNGNSKSDIGNSWRRFLPPGFRHANPIHILLSLPVYAMIVGLSMGLTVNGAEPGTETFSMWYYRFMVLIVSLATVCFACNYCNIQKHFHFCQHNNILVRILAKIIWSIIIWVALLIVFLLLMLPFLTLFRT